MNLRCKPTRAAIRYVAAIVIVANTVAVSAQIPTSTADRVTHVGAQDDYRVRKSDAVLQAVARCTVDRATPRIVNILNSVPGSNDEGRLIHSLQSRMDWCFPGSDIEGVGFNNLLLRGALAEALFRFRHLSAVNAATTSGAKTPIKAQVSDRDSPNVVARIMMADAAYCLASAQPALVDALIGTEHFSREETKAFGMLTKPLGFCLYQGSNATFSQQSLRAVLAEAAYQRAVGISFEAVAAPAAEKK